jgi:CheY-like chemotaxis protein
MTDKSKVCFVLIEDNEDHAYLIQRALRDEGVVDQLHVFSTAEDGIRFLEESAELPHVVLLDIKLPGMSGHDCLRFIKSHPRLSVIPVAVLSTSDADDDRSQAYNNRANSYLTKPIDFEKFKELVEEVGQYWGNVNQPLDSFL